MERKDVTTPLPKTERLLKWMIDQPVTFAEFGLDRTLPAWRPIDWSKPVLHLGPGEKNIPNTVEYDWPAWDFDALNVTGTEGFGTDEWVGAADLKMCFPHEPGSVGGVIATHVLEHLEDPRPLLREVSRILAPGCPFNILVPHGESLMFKQDLDHRTAFVIETWKTLLENPYYTKEHDGFDFVLGANFLFGVKESNLALVTQLIKR